MNKVRKRRLVIWTVLALAAVVLVGLAVAPRPVPVDLEQARRGDLQVTLDHEGKTRVRDRFEISAPLPGRVLRIGLDPGDPVRAGETVLATFEPSAPVPLDARSRAEAQARLRAGDAARDRARADRERIRAEHDLALTERERARRLAGEGIVSEDQLDRAEAEARAMGEALASAEAAVRNATHELEVANAGLLEFADGQAVGGRTVLTLRSPVDGVVLRKLRESEAVVPAGEPILVVADPTDLEIVADYLSSDAVRMRPGMQARIERWGGDRPLTAHVRRIEPSGFMKVSALGVEEQRVNVILDFDDKTGAGALGDGYRVEVRVVVEDRRDVVKVPTGSLFRRDDSWAVFVVEGNRARLRVLTLGAKNGLEAEVVRGVEATQTVVLHPPDELADGMRIKQR